MFAPNRFITRKSKHSWSLEKQPFIKPFYKKGYDSLPLGSFSQVKKNIPATRYLKKNSQILKDAESYQNNCI